MTIREQLEVEMDKQEIEEWCKQIKKDIDKTGKFTPLFDYL